jgi:hypothetical protein
VVYVDHDYHGLSIHSDHSRGLYCRIFQLPRTRITFAWLLVHLIGLPWTIRAVNSYCSSGPSGSSPTPLLFHVVPVARCNYHGLLVYSLIYSSSRKHSTFRTLVVGCLIVQLAHRCLLAYLFCSYLMAPTIAAWRSLLRAALAVVVMDGVVAALALLCSPVVCNIFR